MPPKRWAPNAPPPPPERRVTDNVAAFGLTEDAFRAFCQRARSDLLADDPDTRNISPFLDPRSTDRYVVVSVDPAGGGALSDEAFLVFLVAEGRYGLLTGRIVPGHTGRYGFSMIPLVFVAALLQTIRGVRTLLAEAYARTNFAQRGGGGGGGAPLPFAMPPVLVLIENNFAYGAATYAADGAPAAAGTPRMSPRLRHLRVPYKCFGSSGNANGGTPTRATSR